MGYRKWTTETVMDWTTDGVEQLLDGDVGRGLNQIRRNRPEVEQRLDDLESVVDIPRVAHDHCGCRLPPPAWWRCCCPPRSDSKTSHWLRRLTPAPPIAAGGIANGGNAVLNNTEVDNNTASFTSGGGIVNHGTMTLNKSEVNGNTAAGTGLSASGGGIISAQGPPGTPITTLTLNNSEVNNNRAGGDGGGIANGSPRPARRPCSEEL